MSFAYTQIKEPLFHKLDIFGFGFSFLIGEKEKYRSCCGALLTIFYVFIVVCLFFGFGMDMYLRRRPKVSFNSFVGEYKEIMLSNLNFTYAYRIEDSNGLMMHDQSVAYLELAYFHYQMEDGKWSKKNMEIKENKKCRDLPYTEEKEETYNVNLENWYCLDFENVKMGGNWDGDFVYGLQINAKQCSNNSNRNCSSREKILSTFESDLSSSNLFYSDLSIEMMPTMDDYEQPLKTNLKYRQEMLNLNITKRKVQSFKLSHIKNDKGWFFSETEDKSTISTGEITNDFTLKNTWNQDLIFSKFIYFGTKDETYNRSYVKIQEVFASIGGFSTFFFFVMDVLFSSISEVYKNLLLINNIPYENNDDLNKIERVRKHYTFANRPNDRLEQYKNSDKLERKKSVYVTNEVSLRNYICYFWCGRKKYVKEDVKRIFNKYSVYRKHFNHVMNVLTYFHMYNEITTIKKILLDETYKNYANGKPNTNENLENENDMAKKLSGSCLDKNTFINDQCSGTSNNILE